jgi:diguanylate cyclase (GGDEF)-like protein
MTESKLSQVVSIGIIGAGDGARQLLDIFHRDPGVNLLGIAYRSEDRPTIQIAKERGIPTFDDYRILAENPELNLIIDASDSLEVERYLLFQRRSPAEVLKGYGAWLMWRMVEDYKERQADLSRSLEEQELLYSSGVMLASAADTARTLTLIMEAALSISRMDAGSLAIYEEELGEMVLKVSSGFGDEGPMQQELRWPVRTGGLTGHILSNTRPTVIPDLVAETRFDTKPLQDLGVRSLIATPLNVEGKIIGILYVDGFTPREFTEREINIMSLLAVQSAAALDKAILFEKAELLSVTDELTKLYNHRYFIRSLDKEIKRAKRQRYPLGLVMIDVDYFKKYNDTFGHLEGNVVLKTLAEVLRETARDTDIVARYGGEEFSVILIQADEEKSRIVAERIRKGVEKCRFNGEEKLPDGRLTISVGAAVYDGASELSALIESADRALYRSKKAGRNRVTFYTDLTEEEAAAALEG